MFQIIFKNIFNRFHYRKIHHQEPSKIKEIVGYSENQKRIFDLDFRCMRKPDLTYNDTPYFVLMSHPSFKEKIHFLKPFLVLHCLKDDNLLKSQSPKYLLPASDFIDHNIFPCTENKIKYDYVYFTINKKNSGNAFKGLNIFFDCLPIFDDMGLKGCIVIYFDDHSEMPIREKEFKKYNLKCIKKRLGPFQVARLMASAKFTFFPNVADCSPRMISETFLQNRPVLLNKNIWGGWHYLERHKVLGRFFSPEKKASLIKAVEEIMSLENYQKNIYLKNYGFVKSSRKLAELIRLNYKLPIEISHVFFKDYVKMIFKS